MIEDFSIGKDHEAGESLHPDSAEEPDYPRHGRTKGRRPANANTRGVTPGRSGSGKAGSKAAGGYSSGSDKRKRKLSYKKYSGKK